jgi:hypothetical protein
MILRMTTDLFKTALFYERLRMLLQGTVIHTAIGQMNNEYEVANDRSRFTDSPPLTELFPCQLSELHDEYIIPQSIVHSKKKSRKQVRVRVNASEVGQNCLTFVLVL